MTQTYEVSLSRQPNTETTVATVRDFELRLAVKSGDPGAGFNAVETLLSAAGACISSSLGLVARNSNVQIDRLDVVVKGIRQDQPPMLLSIKYRLFLVTPETDEKVDRIFRIAQRNSTVISTLRQSIPVEGNWTRIGTIEVPNHDF